MLFFFIYATHDPVSLLSIKEENMPQDYRYAGYPSAKVYDEAGNEIHHLLWGDWVNVKEPAGNGRVKVHARNTDGYMKESDLQKERVLEVVFVDVGQGDGCLVVTPDDRKLIIDAGQEDNMYRFLNWRFNFLGGIRQFDAAVLTHPDQDHYKGFSKLFENENIRFDKVYHNGIIETVNKSRPLGEYEWNKGIKYITQVMETRDDLEHFINDPDLYGTKRYPNLLKKALSKVPDGNNVCMLHASDDPMEPVYMEGFEGDKELSIRVLGPVPESIPQHKTTLRWFEGYGDKPDKGKTKNGHSVLLKLTYRDVSLLFGGDLNTASETYLMQHYTGLLWPPNGAGRMNQFVETAAKTFGVDIVKCCHHGSADFTEAFLEATKPAATVISSGDEESHAHPRCDTLGAIGLHGRGWRPLILSTELARSTREDEGDKHIQLGKIIQKIEDTDSEAKLKDLKKKRDDLIAELGKRNVTVYGAINMRTDGKKVVFGYMLEKARSGYNFTAKIKTKTKWDIYRMEKRGEDSLNYID